VGSSDDGLNQYQSHYEVNTTIQSNFGKRKIKQAGEIASTNMGQTELSNAANISVNFPGSEGISQLEGNIKLYPSYISYLLDVAQVLTSQDRNFTFDQLLMAVELFELIKTSISQEPELTPELQSRLI
jgi:Tfp pilus assembly protein PilZ